MITEVQTISNDDGQKIKIIIDKYSIDVNQQTIIIVPGFGKTSVDFGLLSLYLTSHEFNVVRFDPTNHTGESEGDMFDFTLSSLYKDLSCVISFVRNSLKTDHLGLLAFSLGARVGIKAIANFDELVAMVGISTVIDIRTTVNLVAEFDIYKAFQEDRTLQSHEIMDEIVSRNFIDDSIKNGWCDLDNLESNFAVEKAILSINGQQDEWINLDLLVQIFEPSPQRSVVILRNSEHSLNLINGKIAMKQAVSFFCRELRNITIPLDEIETPKFSDVIGKVKQDRKLLAL